MATRSSCRHWLWFAFILLSLSYQEQQPHPFIYIMIRCDLLSFYYLCRTRNNHAMPLPYSTPLWFAFILLSLSYQEQQARSTSSSLIRCDLLSFYYLCRTRNNASKYRPFSSSVVICFHFTIFVVPGTTGLTGETTESRCDLLSFYYLCRTRNNSMPESIWISEVVICFHFTIFVVPGTTTRYALTVGYRCDLLSFYYLCRTRNNSSLQTPRPRLLWFAFILLSLSYQEQLHLLDMLSAVSCDLLSFYYLCRTRNNSIRIIRCMTVNYRDY